ncbi:MAG: response regulator [Tepidiformaceae bacterium]
MRATLLIVEDEVSLRRLMRLMLEREGFLVRDAGNGLEALDAIAEYGLPDLALVDLMMPVMNGQEFVAEVSARGWEMPAIFVSASPEAQEVCAQMGMACVRKPYDFHVLVEAIDAVLAERAAA